MPLGILELIRRVGEEHVGIQNVVQHLAGAQMRKGGVTELAFFTREVSATELMLGTQSKIGLVVWLPKDRVEQAHRDWQAAENAKGKR